MKSKEDKILIKKYCDKKRGMVLRDCLQSSQTNIGHNCKASAAEDHDTVERSTDNLPVEENEKILLNKKYSIISVKIC